MNGCAILTYHSQNIDGHGTADNDHVALAADLEALHRAGARFVPLTWVVDWLDGDRPAADLEGAVALTFDDGSVFDVRDVDYPGWARSAVFSASSTTSPSATAPTRSPGCTPPASSSPARTPGA